MPSCQQQPIQRIAFVSVHGCPMARLGEPEAGGMNVYLLQVAKKLGQRGIAVDVFTRSHDPRDSQIVDLGPNTRIIHIRAGPYAERKHNLPWYLPQFLERLREFVVQEELSYELIHSHYWLSGWIGQRLATLWNVPHVTTPHTLAQVKLLAHPDGQEPESRGNWEREVMQSADLVLTFSPDEQQAITHLYGIASSKIQVAPAGVDATLFSPLDRKTNKILLGLEDKQVLLYVGRIDPIKGIDLLLNAAALLENRDRLRVVIVGSDDDKDPEVDRLQKATASLGLDHNTLFVGAIPQVGLPRYYAAADVVVLPSFYESFGLVALEAMACGTPVVATKVGGLSSLVVDGETGYLVQWRCAETFAQPINKLLANHTLRKSFGEAGRQRALSLTWDNTASQLARLYAHTASASSNTKLPSINR